MVRRVRYECGCTSGGDYIPSRCEMHDEPVAEVIEEDDERFTTLPEETRYSYIRNGLFAQLLMGADLEIEYDEEGEQWIFSDKGGPLCYGTGETPQKALDDYIKGVQMTVVMQHDSLMEEEEAE